MIVNTPLKRPRIAQNEKAITLLNMQNALIASGGKDVWGKESEPPWEGYSLTL